MKNITVGCLGLICAAAAHSHARSPERQACPDFRGHYCCGVSLGDIQKCLSPLQIEQSVMGHDTSYAFIDRDGGVLSRFTADGAAHEYDNGTFSGDATTTCDGTSVLVEIPAARYDAIPGATGWYRYSVNLRTDGWMTFRSDCSFSDHGTPVLTSCGIGTGYGCQRK